MERTASKLLLARHGQARAADGSYGEDTPLSALGRRQAESLADELASRDGIAALYSSPFPRAVQTARPVAERLGLEAVVDRRLSEFDLPKLPHLSPGRALVERTDLLYWQPDHAGTQGGETMRDFALRVASFCDEAVARHAGQTVAVVCHSGTIDAALRWAVGLPPDAPWQVECDVPNASVTTLEMWPRGRVQGGAPRHAVIGPVGDTAHLGDLGSDL